MLIIQDRIENSRHHTIEVAIYLFPHLKICYQDVLLSCYPSVQQYSPVFL